MNLISKSTILHVPIQTAFSFLLVNHYFMYLVFIFSTAVIYPLLEHKVQIKDALLRAVEHDFGEAVRILCDVANKSRVCKFVNWIFSLPNFCRLSGLISEFFTLGKPNIMLLKAHKVVQQ